MSELRVAPEAMSVPWAQLHAELTRPRRIAGARQLIGRAFAKQDTRLLVVDDDPTGSQWVHGVDVLTHWAERERRDVLSSDAARVTFLLTNTRAVDRGEARAINEV